MQCHDNREAQLRWGFSGYQRGPTWAAPGTATGAETLVGSQHRRTVGAAGGGGLEEMRVGPQEVLPAEEGREERACEQQDLTAASFLGLIPASQPSCLAERQHGLPTAVQDGLPVKEHGERRGKPVREQPDLLVGTQPALSLTAGLAVRESSGLNPFPRAWDWGLLEGRAGAEDHAFLFQSTQGVQSAATSHVDVRPRRRGRGCGRARTTERGCLVAQQGQQHGDHWDQHRGDLREQCQQGSGQGRQLGGEYPQGPTDLPGDLMAGQDSGERVGEAGQRGQQPCSMDARAQGVSGDQLPRGKSRRRRGGQGRQWQGTPQGQQAVSQGGATGAPQSERQPEKRLGEIAATEGALHPEGQPRMRMAPQGVQQPEGQPGMTGAPHGVQHPGRQQDASSTPRVVLRLEVQPGETGASQDERQPEDWLRGAAAPEGDLHPEGQPGARVAPQGVQQPEGQPGMTGAPHGVQHPGGQSELKSKPQDLWRPGGQSGVTAAPQSVQKAGGKRRVTAAPQGMQQAGG
ncbi:unnamed protein product [Closterium sp. Naga37s-1]|nr:unnamed protein product [Closterium sp. Naga37s-1]